MAVLTQKELAELRRETVKGQTVDFTKPQINLALQAVEDFFVANRPALNSAINSATSPFTFPPAIKKRIIAHWFKQKFRREGA